MDEIEEWRDIPEWEGWYQASNLGRIRSVARLVTLADGRKRMWPTKVMTPQRHTNGYQCLRLTRNQSGQTYLIHRLVALTFIGPCPDGLEVAHNDGTRTNNRLSNLRYDTPLGNTQDKFRHGTVRRGVENGCAKLTASIVRYIRGSEKSRKQLASEIGVSYMTIARAQRGLSWAHV